MSKPEYAKNPVNKAVALRYGAEDAAPVVVASGMGYMAEKIVETASAHGVPIYEDNSLSTLLTQLQLGQEIPENLYQAIVEIYIYFLHFDPTEKENAKDAAAKSRREPAAAQTEKEEKTQTVPEAAPALQQEEGTSVE